MDCNNFFDVGLSDKYRLHHFTFSTIDINNKRGAFDPTIIPGAKVNGVRVNGKKL